VKAEHPHVGARWRAVEVSSSADGDPESWRIDASAVNTLAELAAVLRALRRRDAGSGRLGS
jgi:hypothetical protein